ncbi:MAG: thiamine phosphate synthase [Phycisphaeraceae bacterium]
MPTPLRILDANANRAREALRVLEDAARFLLDDSQLSSQFKQLRHDLAAALAPFPDLPLHRDTPHDVGTRITTPSESHRPNIASVTTAAGKRLTEALRTLEEFAKLPKAVALQGYGSASPLQRAGSLGTQFESLRYRAYILESAIHRRFALPDPRKWKLCVLVTESLCTHHPWFDVAQAALDAGADCIQLREKNIESADLLDRARRLVELIASFNDAIPSRAAIINDRIDIALASNAHGVHLGQSDLPIAHARNIAGHRLLIGVSTHNLTEARHAAKQQADYLGVGAMFPTSTKNRKPTGPRYLRQFLKQFPDLPHLAIGGITPDNIHELVNAGVRAVAVSSCVCNVKSLPEVARITRRLRRAIP